MLFSLVNLITDELANNLPRDHGLTFCYMIERDPAVITCRWANDSLCIFIENVSLR